MEHDEAWLQAEARDKRLTLAFLWAWVLFNYVYADILHIFLILMNPSALAQLQSGRVGGVPLNETTLLGMAVGMELAIMMVFLSWKLAYRPNRILNIVLGLLFTLVIGAILFGSGRVPPVSGYTLYGLIEMATTLAIVWLAWSWRPPAVDAQTSA